MYSNSLKEDVNSSISSLPILRTNCRGLETIPSLIFENNLLKEEGLLVLEHGKKDNFEDHPNFVERRVYGSVNFSFFEKLKVESL